MDIAIFEPKGSANHIALCLPFIGRAFQTRAVMYFQPFYLHGPHIPASYADGTSSYSENSAWWSANRVKLLCDLNHGALGPVVRGVFDATERAEMSRQYRLESQAKSLIEAGRERDAVNLLQGFIDENFQRTGREYKMWNGTLPSLLRSVGIEYLFTEYMRSWTAKSGVPLPLP